MQANVDVENELTSNCEKYIIELTSSKLIICHLWGTKLVSVCHYEISLTIAVVAAMSGNKDYKSATSIYDFTATSIKGEEIPLSK